MNLKKIFFGEEIILQDNFFGQIESCKTRSRTAKSLTWFFKFKISDFKFETEIIAEGDYLGINSDSKDALVDFISNFDCHYSQNLNNLIDINPKFEKLRIWKNDYYISVIHPSLSDSPTSNFEIFFQAYNNKNRLFMTELISKNLINLEIIDI